VSGAPTPTTPQLTTTTPDQTRRVGEAVGRAARAGDVIALVGELGAGKTQLVRGLAAGLGLDAGAVSSPTFVLMHEYEPADADGLALVHIDAYRLTGPDELATIGWGEELWEGAVVAVEWADRVAAALGDAALTITLEHTPEGRRLTFTAGTAWAKRLRRLPTDDA